MYQVEEKRESGEKDRALAVPKEKGLQDLYEDPVWDLGTDDQPAGKDRAEGLISGIQRSKAFDRV